MKKQAALLLIAVVPALAGTPVLVPEPSTTILVGGGVLCLMLWMRRKRGRK